MDTPQLVTILKSRRFNFTSEEELQEGIALALCEEGVSFEREKVLAPGSRIDFLTSGLGLEVKLECNLAALTRQLHRYAQCDEVKALVVVTSRTRHMALPLSLNGKTIEVVHLMNNAL